MHLDRHHFHFFGSKDIHALYLTIALLTFAEGIIGIFIPLFLWSLGYSLAWILVFYAVNSAAFLALTALLLPLIRQLRDTTMIGVSLPFLIAYYLGLHALASTPWLFWVLPVVLAVHMLLFNVGYHAHFTGAADGGHVGREVGMRYVVSSVAQLGAPALGGVLIASYGFPIAFAVGSAILLTSALPLLRATPHASAPGIHLPAIARALTDPAIRDFTWSGVGYAIAASVGRVIWPLALFASIGSIRRLGILVTVGFLVELLTTSMAGVLSDTRRRSFVLRATATASALVWVTRPFLAGPLGFGGSHLLGNAITAALMVAWSSQYYDLARAHAAPGAFILSREVLYHLARVALIPPLIVAAVFLPTSTFFSASFTAAGVLTLFHLRSHRLGLRPSPQPQQLM